MRYFSIGALLFGCLFLTACSSQSTAQNTDMSQYASTDELEIQDIKEGSGTEAIDGSTVKVHYVGTLVNGSKFDSSRDRFVPYEFKLGEGKVIQGWDIGVPGMKVGGVRRLIIPPGLAYGAKGSGSKVPPNSVLVFEIELLEVK